jgi:hypothetical protein
MRALLAITAGGSALPSWLSFNPSTRTFSGTPTSTDVGTISVRGTANDLGSLAASETFNITVSTTPNGAPTAPRSARTIAAFSLLSQQIEEQFDGFLFPPEMMDHHLSFGADAAPFPQQADVPEKVRLDRQGVVARHSLPRPCVRHRGGRAARS